MSQKIRAVGFDLGGVLVGYTMDQQLWRMSEELGVAHEQFLPVFRRYHDALDVGGLTEEAFWSQVAADLASKTPVAALLRVWTEWYGQHNALVPEMIELIDRLRTAGYRVGLLSNIDQIHGEHYRQLGLLDHFDAALFSNELHRSKPHPEAYQALRDGLEVEYDELVFVDDYDVNTRAAAELGIQTILFQSYRQTVAELAKLGIV